MKKLLLISVLLVESLYATGEGSAAGADAAIKLSKPKGKEDGRVLSRVKNTVLPYCVVLGIPDSGSNAAYGHN